MAAKRLAENRIAALARVKQSYVGTRAT